MLRMKVLAHVCASNYNVCMGRKQHRCRECGKYYAEGDPAVDPDFIFTSEPCQQCVVEEQRQRDEENAREDHETRYCGDWY